MSANGKTCIYHGSQGNCLLRDWASGEWHNGLSSPASAVGSPSRWHSIEQCISDLATNSATTGLVFTQHQREPHAHTSTIRFHTAWPRAEGTAPSLDYPPSHPTHCSQCFHRTPTLPTPRPPAGSPRWPIIPPVQKLSHWAYQPVQCSSWHIHRLLNEDAATTLYFANLHKEVACARILAARDRARFAWTSAEPQQRTLPTTGASL